MCWNEKVFGGDDVVTDLVMPFDPLAESNDDDTLVGKLDKHREKTFLLGF